MNATLRLLKGTGKERVFDLGEVAFIGRDDDNQVVIADGTCSRHHAKLTRTDAGYVLSDLGSNNGTFLNGQKVEKAGLSPGDRLMIGSTIFIFEGEQARGDRAAQTVVIGDAADALLSGGSVTSSPAESVARVDSSQRRAEMLDRVLSFSQDLLRACGNRQAIAGAAVSAVTKAVPASGLVCLIESDPAGGEPIISACATPPGAKGRSEISRSVISRVMSDGQGILVENPGEPGRGAAQSVAGFGIRSIACVPVLLFGEVRAVLYADARGEGPAISAETLDFMMTASRQLSPALESAISAERSFEELNRLRRSTMPAREPGCGVAACRAVETMIEKVAGTDATVLVTGESGVGKEYAAVAIHRRSLRSAGPFVPLNCAAIVETLIESELFGHERGAFTGATERRKGRFEAADGGTIFLDEIAELSPAMQAKLLRVLQDRMVFRVGSTRALKVDVRVIAATNRDLKKMVESGAFREDLFYRLGAFVIEVPALRDRREAIPQLVYQFLEESCREMKKDIRSVTPGAMDFLCGYRWPGNIRQLRNVIERAVVLCDGGAITGDLLPPEVTESPSCAGVAPAVAAMSLADAERAATRGRPQKYSGSPGLRSTGKSPIMALNRKETKKFDFSRTVQ
jgi:DNA-binding NtrC family response regulator